LRIYPSRVLHPAAIAPVTGADPFPILSRPGAVGSDTGEPSPEGAELLGTSICRLATADGDAVLAHNASEVGGSG
jgi:hypothetical protein